MIDIKALTQEDIGRKVIFETQYVLDEGVISSYNNKVVFVLYGTCTTPQATSPEALTFSF